MTNICYWTKDTGGCTYYRGMLPLDTLYELKLADVMRLEKGEEQERIASAIVGADVVLFLRVTANETFLKIIDSLKSDGKLVVMDYDDNVFEVNGNPLSPHYRDYGIEEFEMVSNGKLVKVWVDGVGGFSIARNKERLALIKEAMLQADLITTTTDYLAKVIRNHNPNVAVLPNCVDLRRWQRAPVIGNEYVKMFWAGGSSHYEDWTILKDVLVEVLNRFPRLHLVLMGVKFENIIKDLPISQVEFYPWEETLSYPLRVSLINPDFSIIPLADNNEFNLCKSAIKFVEQGALGVPCIMSEVGPYKTVYNGKNAILVRGNDPQAWVDAITYLFKNPAERRLIGLEARKTVTERFDIAKQCKLWLDAYAQAGESRWPSSQLVTSS